MYPYLAFHSCDLYFKVAMEDAFNKEDTYELDRLIAATPASASILDILTASGKDASAVLDVTMGGASEVKRITKC